MELKYAASQGLLRSATCTSQDTMVQSFSIPAGSFAIHPWIRTRQLCTARKGDFAIFCTKKEGYLGVCQATKRVDSTGERLYITPDALLPPSGNAFLRWLQQVTRGGASARIRF